MAVVCRIRGFVMVVEIVWMASMNQLIVVWQIELVQLDFGNVIMEGVLVQSNDVMVLMIAGRETNNKK